MVSIAEGDKSAFTTLFERHAGKVLGYSIRLLGGDSTMAEDISQTVWMKVVQNAHSYRGEGTFIAWIHTLARNTVIDEMRKKREELISVESSDDFDGSDKIENAKELSVASFENELLEKSDLVLIKQAMDDLPEAQRIVLTIWLVEELSYEDIAARMNQSVQGVKSLLFRARQNLRDKMKGQL